MLTQRVVARAFSGAWLHRGHATLTGTVGFIGIGNMGGPMASNLLQAGLQLLVYDRNPAALERLQQQGATPVEHPRALAEAPGVGAVLSMLPSTEHVQDAYEGPLGLLSGGGPLPPLLLDCSTILPTYTRHLAGLIASRSSSTGAPPPGSTASNVGAAPLFVDAPVSGGVSGAAAASLTFMCGGSPEAVAAARPLLNQMGKAICHVGPAGAGQVAKICNNLVMGVTMAGLAEALALGAAAGLDPATLSALINAASGRCWSSEVYNPVPGVCPGAPASRGYAPGFSASLMAKDLRLALQLAAAGTTGSSGAAPAAGLPLGQTAAQLYQQLVEAQPEPTDFSAIYAVVYGGAPPPSSGQREGTGAA